MTTLGALLIAAAFVAYILQPVITGRSAPMVRSEDEATEVEVRKRIVLMALRDVEYDYATGKLDDADYQSLRAELGTEVLAFISEEEGAAALSGTGEIDALEQEIAAYRSALKERVACPRCTALNVPGSRFCAQCGSPIQALQTAAS